MGVKRPNKPFKKSERATNVADLTQDQINSLIDQGVSVGSRRRYNFPKRTKESRTTGIPASKHVADAVKGGHITPAEGLELNRAYLQHMPEGTVIPKKPKPKAKAKKAPIKESPNYTIRVVNGREFKVFNVPEDKSAPKKHRKAERNANRNIYRPKNTKY